MWRKTVVATAIVGAGLAATTGSAFAGQEDQDQDRSTSHEESGRDGGHEGGHDSGRDGGDEGHGEGHGEDERGGDSCGSDVSTEDEGETNQSGLVNVADTDTIVPTELCQNNIPVNVLGVQVPIQDLGLNLPVLSPSDDGGGNTAETS